MKCQACGAALAESGAPCTQCGWREKTSDRMIGRTLLGQYQVTRLLGRGGFGAVYEAEQRSVGRKAAIKILYEHLAHQPAVLIRFRREGLATSRLSHPSIVKVYNFGETDDGILWFAMEHIEGETLSVRIRRQGSLSLDEAVQLFTPICEALTEAHEKGIVHRDLKPDNIMLPKDGGVPRLLDFGVASLMDDVNVTETGMMSGSPPYMSPEQWRGLKHTDARSDVYALGIVAYQCLTGHLPFEADTAPGWMQKHCLEQPLSFAHWGKDQLSMAAQSVVMRAIHKQPEARFQSAALFLEALSNAARGIAPPALTETQAPIVMQAPIEAQKTSPMWLLFLVLPVAIMLAVGLSKQRAVQSSTPTITQISAPTTAQTSAPSTIKKIEEPQSAPTTLAENKTKQARPLVGPKPPKAPETKPAKLTEEELTELREATIGEIKSKMTQAKITCQTDRQIGEHINVPKILVAPSGEVILAEVFASSPAAQCIQNMVLGMRFAPFNPQLGDLVLGKTFTLPIRYK